MASQVFNDIFM